jgi:prevent-host-death family protein
MRSVKLRDAKAGLSEIVEAAEGGEPTTITKHGRPAAVVVPVDTAKALLAAPKMSFGKFLLTYPGGVELERDQSSSRDIDL